MTVDIDEAKALLDAFGELYHAAWYAGDGSPFVCNQTRDLLAEALAGNGVGEVVDQMKEDLGL